jgi:hypothetical protein
LPARQVKSKYTSSQVLIRLQYIYQDLNIQPRSEGQAAVLELVYNLLLYILLIVVLPTSSSKSVLFFSVAAITSQQTVIVVVLFAVLVDNIVVQGQAAGLIYKE